MELLHMSHKVLFFFSFGSTNKWREEDILGACCVEVYHKQINHIYLRRSKEKPVIHNRLLDHVLQGETC